MKYENMFEDARFLGKYWLIIFDAAGLFHFKEHHCQNCLKKTLNKGKAAEELRLKLNKT
ncbi:MAG: hypothetical protein K2N34_03275 [Lachnospiraceae bacterium]|nr:hypothetical protein [Lachnospiraceae bacterium]